MHHVINAKYIVQTKWIKFTHFAILIMPIIKNTTGKYIFFVDNSFWLLFFFSFIVMNWQYSEASIIRLAFRVLVLSFWMKVCGITAWIVSKKKWIRMTLINKLIILPRHRYQQSQFLLCLTRQKFTSEGGGGKGVCLLYLSITVHQLVTITCHFNTSIELHLTNALIYHLW